MRLAGWHRIASLLAAALVAPPAMGAQGEPYAGYIYPAGGRRGAAFEATVGGQHLNGAARVLVSGAGVTAEVLEYIRPLSQREIMELRQKLRDFQKRAQEARGSRAGRPGGEQALNPEEVKRIAVEVGLEAQTLEDIAALGKELNDPKRQINPQIADIVRLRVTAAPDAAPGERELRLVAAGGISNPVRLHIGTWVEHLETEPNDRVPDAGITGGPPMVINGQIMPGDVDRFRFAARKDARLVIAVQARALVPYLADAVPGWFQAACALYDAHGKEVAYADSYRFHPDPVLYYEVPEDGAYVLEIKDALYRGRADFVYRITVGALPFVTHVFPLGGRVGDPVTVDVRGWNLPVKTLSIDTAHMEPGVAQVSVRTDDFESNRVPFAVDTLPEIGEAEPNDDPAGAQRIAPPLIVNGRIDRPGDVDVFRFAGRAGDRLVAEVLARRLGSPLDSLLTLTSADGALITVNDDHEEKGEGLLTHHADSRIDVTLPGDGEYYLRLVDVQGKGGGEYGYRLRVGSPRPDFALRVVPCNLNLRAGSTLPVTVYALREDDFDGEISLALKNAPKGFSLGGAWMPPGQDAVRVTLTAPPNPLSEPVQLVLEGSAVIDGRPVHRQAVPAQDMMQAFFYRHLVPSHDWQVSVRGRARSLAGVRHLGASPVTLHPGAVTRVALAAPRGILGENISLELLDPPTGVTLKNVAPARGGVTLVLDARAGAAVPGAKGNLIINTFTERTDRPKAPGAKTAARRVALGTLPAIPYQIAEP